MDKEDHEQSDQAGEISRSLLDGSIADTLGARAAIHTSVPQSEVAVPAAKLPVASPTPADLASNPAAASGGGLCQSDICMTVQICHTDVCPPRLQTDILTD